MIELTSEQSIFLKAITLPSSAERQAYLDEVCRDKPELRGELDALLAAHDLLRSQTAPTQAGQAPSEELPSPSSEVPGTTIGLYKLIERIGEGGMGTVWMAQQTEPIKRVVALKVIKAGLDSKQIIARFEAERQALALMDHPNIAKVFDGGAIGASVEPSGRRDAGEPRRADASTLAWGRPYFVMELVKGVPITKYCDEHHLTPRQRLELFIPVCQAIQHAHQKGIIHRDLKPSNVLVAHPADPPLAKGGPGGMPKVIDFGVAKATGQSLTDKTLVTGFGAIVGTLEYMSPEQAEINQLDIDTRSDIYSLGVLLYELLAGSPPFHRKELQNAGMLEILRVIREEEPSKPSAKLSTAEGLPTLAANRGTEPAKLTKLLRGELDWIVMKALDKDRNRRYETANSFAMDVQRYLADEAVHACPPSAAYRLRKFVRRNKRPVLAASLVILALIAGVAGTTVGLVEARGQRDAAKAAAVAESDAKDDAQAREKETKAVLEFVDKHVFAAARPDGEAGGLGHDVTLRKAIEAALPFVAKSFPDQPLIEARLRMTMGTSFLYLGDAAQAAEQFQGARTLYARCRGPDHRDTLQCNINLAITLGHFGRHAEALRLREETAQRYEARYGPDDPGTLLSMGNLALSYAELGQHADALKLREKTLALATIRLGPTHQQTLWLMMGLADSQAALGRNLDALNLREKTLTLARANLESDHLTTLLIMHGLADSYAAVGREADALALHEDTLARMKAKLGPGHPATLNSMAGAAKSLIKLDRGAEAVPVIDECLRRATARFVDRTLFPELLELRSQQFAKWAESLGCRQTAEMWEKLNRTDAQSLYTAARLRAVSAAVLRQDKTEEIAKQADAEANLAMDWLQKAVAAGFQDVNRMNKETDFDFLRERADFRNLVAKLEAVRKNEMR